MSIDATCTEPTALTAMTFTAVPGPPRSDAPDDVSDDAPDVVSDSGMLDIDAWEGWQALAVATLGRPLTDAEHAAVQALSTEHVLDLLFPDLTAEAREEALWALG